MSAKDVHSKEETAEQKRYHADVISAQANLLCYVSAITFYRGLLPEHGFQKQPLSVPEGEETIWVPVMQGGMSRRTECMLSWLEVGAFQLLRRGVLVGVQIGVHPEPKRRNVVYESYTLTFQSHDVLAAEISTKGTRTEATDSLQRLEDGRTTNLRSMIESMKEMVKKMPELPDKLYITMSLFTSNGEVYERKVRKFHRMPYDVLNWPQVKDHTRQKVKGPVLLSNRHGISLAATYMSPVKGAKVQKSLSFALKTYKHAMPVDEDFDAAFMMNMPDVAEFTKTPASQTHAMAKALIKLAETQQLTQGDTQTASFGATQSIQHIDKDLQLHLKISECHYTRAQSRVSQGVELAAAIGGKTSSGEELLCICSFSQEEHDMVCCSICATWQHLHCYGYIGKNDPRRPVQHMCYNCFVNPRENETLVALIEQALTRRAMYRCLRYGIMSKSNFTEVLHMDSGISSPIFAQLRSKGFVIAASGSHKAGFKTGGRPPWVPASGSAYGQMLDALFDPTTLVEKYFLPNHTKPSELMHNLQVAPAANMPHAAVSTGERRKRAADKALAKEQAIEGARQSTSDSRTEDSDDDVDEKPTNKKPKIEVLKADLQYLASEQIIAS